MTTTTTTSPPISFDGEQYLKSVYHDVKKWIHQQQQQQESSAAKTENNDEESSPQLSPPILWIVLDDVSSLATILGDKVVYCFVDSILSLVSTVDNCGTIIRCSIDLDQMAYKQLAIEDKDVSGWIGSGGLSIKQSQKDQSMYNRSNIPWERYLLDNSSVIDGIIDVLPLPSGFSREAHGRLIFSEPPNGRGWGSGYNEQIFSFDECNNNNNDNDNNKRRYFYQIETKQINYKLLYPRYRSESMVSTRQLI